MQTGIVVLLILTHLRFGCEGVAFQLEFSAESIQLRWSVVAGGTTQPRLPRITGNGCRLVRK